MERERALAMPKVELHVHLEGSIRPETVLRLRGAEDHAIPDTLEGLTEWMTFRDFPHFVEVYVEVSKLLRDEDAIELVMTEFLAGQAAQNVLHTEVTYTASTIEKYRGIPWERQKEALQRAIKASGQSVGVIVDIVRGDSPQRALEVAAWAIDGARDGLVIAMGLSGEERLEGPGHYASAIETARDAGLAFVPHAGETEGADSIRACLPFEPARIGHGVRCVEDGRLMGELRDRMIPLELCPSSNVRLGVVPSLEVHPLPRLLDEGIAISINSDDPPMFGTTLTDEIVRCAETFDLSEDILFTLTRGAAATSLLPPAARRELALRLASEWPE